MKIAIIGGGAAGMMAAATITEKNSEDEVILIEKNTRLGRKVVISGGGRCNLTTSTSDIKELLENYPRGAKWLKFAMHEFGPKETYEWFEKNGIPLKTEKKRVFPKSNKGIDLVYAFTKIFTEKNVQVKYNKAVEAVNKKFKGLLDKVKASEKEFEKVMKQTFEVEIYQVEESNVPPLPGNIYGVLEFMIVTDGRIMKIS